MKQAFGATVEDLMRNPTGKVAHAVVRLGDSPLMLSDLEASMAMGTMRANPGSYYLYVDDADALYRRAVQAGAHSEREPADQFYGDRMGAVKDRWDNIWFIATHTEDVTPDKLQERMKAMAGAR